MENTLLVATSYQGALRRQMEVIANNLANMNTGGFKAERMMFVDHLVRSAGSSGGVADQLAFVRDIATLRDPSPGNLVATESPLDVALQGDGFFVVNTPEGERYTRDGHFTLDALGQLVTETGLPVMAREGAPILFARDDTQISISGDGTVSTENGVLGQLRVVRVENPNLMQGTGDGLFATDQIVEDMDQPRIAQGVVEGSNVEPILEMERMIRTHRAYEDVRRLVDREDDRIKKMMQVYAG